jgi:hypothetical protein
MLFVAGSVQASPFLVCNPVPATDPSVVGVSSLWTYSLSGLGPAPVVVPAQINSDGSVQLHYDLAGLANGSYTVTAIATLTGKGLASPSSAPFTFSFAVPAAPTSLLVSPK